MYLQVNSVCMFTPLFAVSSFLQALLVVCNNVQKKLAVIGIIETVTCQLSLCKRVI